jgi:hypothetical protein
MKVKIPISKLKKYPKTFTGHFENEMNTFLVIQCINYDDESIIKYGKFLQEIGEVIQNFPELMKGKEISIEKKELIDRFINKKTL